jgi:transposase InsO family protein
MVRFFARTKERLRTLHRWVSFYNQRRAHTALGGLSAVNNVGGNDS